eukprot:TCONS_00068018-protein
MILHIKAYKMEMFLTICLLHMWCTGSVFSSNIIRMSDQNQATFVLKHRGKRPAQAPYKNITAEEVFDCADACTYDTRCKSINFVEDASDDDENVEENCQLVEYDRNDVNEYVDAPNVKHFDTGRSTLTRIIPWLTRQDGGCLINWGGGCDSSIDDIFLRYTVPTEVL